MDSNVKSWKELTEVLLPLEAINVDSAHDNPVWKNDPACLSPRERETA